MVEKELQHSASGKDFVNPVSENQPIRDWRVTQHLRKALGTPGSHITRHTEHICGVSLYRAASFTLSSSFFIFFCVNNPTVIII